MGTIAAMRRKFEAFDLMREALGIVSETKADIVAYNKAQLMEGREATDVMLREYRSPIYAEYKKTLNPLGVTDLKLTGAFHEGFKVDMAADGFVISSKDGKAGSLVKSYGADIFGLSMESKRGYLEKAFMPKLKAIVMQALGLKLE